MTDTITVFSRTGKLLQTFSVSASRSWTIGESGRAQFEVSARDTDICNETVLLFYNWVLIESDILPSWIGQIGVHNWGSNVVNITAFSPDDARGILGRRIGPNEVKQSGSPGALMEFVINTANQPESTVLRVGNVFKGGDTLSETFNPAPLNKDLKRIQERSKEDYVFRPVVANDGLVVYCDWQERMGIDTQFALWKGLGGGNIELSKRVLVQDAPEANSVFGYGDGQAWTSIPFTTVLDTSSISKYGLIQGSKRYTGVEEVSTISKNAAADLSETKNPSDVFSVFALNEGDTFENVKLGNKVYLNMENVGFTNGNIGTSKYVRIRGMFYDPSKGDKIEIAVSENVTT